MHTVSAIKAGSLSRRGVRRVARVFIVRYLRASKENKRRGESDSVRERRRQRSVKKSILLKNGFAVPRVLPGAL